MALIQVTVADDVKRKADAAFARSGITTPMAMKMFVTQVAQNNQTPFDGLFLSTQAREIADEVKRDMLYAEAQEYGLIPDDSTVGSTIPNSVLRELGLTPEEVGQR